jgi:Tfp pilus assembly protein PilF
MGRIDDVPRHIESVLAVDPDNSDALATYGMYFIKKGDFPAAAQKLKEAHRADRHSPWILKNLAMVHYLMGLHNQALREIRSALKSDPHLFDAHILQGEIYLAKGMLSHARDSWKKALTLRPDSLEALERLMRARSGQGSRGKKKT